MVHPLNNHPKHTSNPLVGMLVGLEKLKKSTIITSKNIQDFEKKTEHKTCNTGFFEGQQ
ncbi:MAG: hypothetical protein VKL39_17115 [Leptolyngbyaceae bacterium]|nr:hypothetical protein [Leptolyngbyaceae bacterium]